MDLKLKEVEQVINSELTSKIKRTSIDFDELLNDVHSTAASAQLVRLSLSGSSEPTP